MKDARLILLGFVGWAAFLILFPYFDPSAQWGCAIDRDAALQAARQSAVELGFPLPDGRYGIRTERRPREEYYLSKHADDPPASFASPLLTTIRAEQATGMGISVDLDRSGKLLGFRRDRPRSESQVHMGSDGILVSSKDESARHDQAEVPPMTPEEGRPIARQALGVLLGSQLSAFEPQGEPLQEGGRLDFSWQAPALSDAAATPEAEVVIREGQAAEASVRLDFAAAFAGQYSSRDDSVDALRVVGIVLLTLVLLAGLGLYLIGSVDREIRHRRTLLTLLPVVLFQALFFIWGGGWDAAVLDDNAWWEALLEQGLFLIFVLLPMIAVCWGVGCMLAVRRQAARVVSADLFFAGNWRGRTTGRSAAWGTLLGGALAAAPYLAAAAVPGAAANTASGWVLSSPIPWVSAFNFLAGGPLAWIFIIFAFLAPLFSCYLKKPRLSRALFLALGGFLLAPVSGIEVSLWAALLCGALAVASADYLFRRVDLLAVLFMGLSAQAARRAYTLLWQPDDTLQMHGWIAFAALGLIGAAGWGISRWGRQVDLAGEAACREAGAQRILSRRRAERERLMAEFSVARKAQQLMLPERPPEIPGYQLAAACRPAREVGGDFYDFLQLEDGRWAVAVADVSGKGVPAALYMTLTKGLLRSVAGQSGEPAQIVSRINTHLYECARRRVFVTMALAILDPSAGKALCVRAGHNPSVWRQSNGESRFLYTSGIGLGLAGSRLFDRSLAVEEVPLQRGDRLILYSDGITEAMDSEGREYGDERFLQAIERSDGLQAASALEHILEDVRQFTGQIPQNDDITIVVLKRLTEEVRSDQ